MVGGNAGGIQVTETSAKAVAAAYGCVSLLADSVSSLPTQLRDGPEIRASKTLPPSRLLTQPYAEISRRDWWVQFIWGLALRGNFFGQIIERDQFDDPVQIKPVHNDEVQVRRGSDGSPEYWFMNQPVPIRDVVHVRYQSSPGSLMGMSPIQVCALTFGIALAQDRYAESFHLNSADPRGVIEVPGQLDRIETRRMYRGWQAAHQGVNLANLPAVLTEGATFKPITMSPQDSQMIEALQFSEERICGRIFRIPPHMVGIVEKESSFGKGLEVQARNYYWNTLVGYLTSGQECMSSQHKRGVFMHFDTTDRERGTTLEKAQAAALLMNSGASTVDDVRPWFDWPDLADGNGKLSFLPINTQLLEAAVLALQQAKEAPAPLPAAEPGGGTPQPAKNGDGRHMSVETAERIVRAAVEQETRRVNGNALLGATLTRYENE